MHRIPITDAILALMVLGTLVAATEFTVARSVRLARALGVSDLFIGLTLLSLGTSLPEISTAVIASTDILLDKVDPRIASGAVLGTNIGSDILQQTFIIAVVAPFGLLVTDRWSLVRDFGVMIGITTLLLVFCWDGRLSRLEGMALVGGYLGYLAYLGFFERQMVIQAGHVKTRSDPKGRPFRDFVFIAAGIVIILLCAHFILKVAHEVVKAMNVGSSLIGVMFIGVASALPELSTAIMALRKKATGLSLGTLIGSNITNPGMAVGLGAMISGYEVPEVLPGFDLPAKIVTGILVGGLLLFRRRIGLLESALMVGCYVTYLVLRVSFFSHDLY